MRSEMRQSALHYLMMKIITCAFVSLAFASVSALAENPVPLINQPLVPASSLPGAAGFILTVNGSNFVSTSVVNWNGSARTTTFVSGSQLTATINPPDVATASTASVTVFNAGPGGGTSNVAFFEVTKPVSQVFIVQSAFGVGTFPDAVTVGDFNGDGKLDLATGNYGENTVSVLLGNGDGTFQPFVAYAADSGSGIIVGDFNNDGKLDLATASTPASSASVLLGNGDGTFQAPLSSAVAINPFNLAAGDFNGDGNLDIVTSNNIGTISVLLGKGDGTFQTHVDYSISPDFASSDSVVVGDFNGDGKLDLAVTALEDNAVSILLGNGDGTFQPAIQYSAGLFADSVAVGDFNGDGKLDLAVADSGVGVPPYLISVLIGNGDGSFKPPVSYSVGDYPFWIITNDFNGDGKLDLASVSFGGIVSLLLGNGDGTFQSHTDYPVSGEPGAVIAGDFNNDGMLDFATADQSTNQVSVNLQVTGVATGVFSPPSLNYPTQLWHTTSAAQMATLTNTGTVALSIVSISTTGNFRQTNDCAASLAPGASCTFSVTFRPGQRGVRTGTVTVLDSDPHGPAILTLLGVGTVVEVSPASLDFGDQTVGTSSSPLPVTITNVSAHVVDFGNIAIVGADPGDFSMTRNCGRHLGGGASCTVSVTFTPKGTGPRTAALQINDDGGGSPQFVSLSGNGT